VILFTFLVMAGNALILSPGRHPGIVSQRFLRPETPRPRLLGRATHNRSNFRVGHTFEIAKLQHVSVSPVQSSYGNANVVAWPPAAILGLERRRTKKLCLSLISEMLANLALGNSTYPGPETFRSFQSAHAADHGQQHVLQQILRDMMVRSDSIQIRIEPVMYTHGQPAHAFSIARLGLGDQIDTVILLNHKPPFTAFDYRDKCYEFVTALSFFHYFSESCWAAMRGLSGRAGQSIFLLLYLGQSDALKGLFLAGLGMAGKPGEPLRGLRLGMTNSASHIWQTTMPIFHTKKRHGSKLLLARAVTYDII
jgi:hypothetical protein